MVISATIKSSYASLPPTTRATALVLGPDPKGKTFLHCSVNSVVIRDIENPSVHDSYYAHQKPPSCAKYSPSGYYICSSDSIGRVRIWDTTQKEHLTKYEFQPLSGTIKDIAWDADSKRIAVCGEGRESFAHAFLWDSGSSIGVLGSMEKSGNSVDIKQTRPYRCAVASEDYKTYFYAGPPFKISGMVENGTRFSNCVRFSPNGNYMATCNSDGRIFLCDGKTGEYIGIFGDPKSHNGGVYSVCFSPDSTELLSASADKTCKIWNVESRQMVVEFVMGKAVEDQQLSCLWQGDHLLAVSLSGDIKYLDRNNPSTPLRVISGHNKSIGALAVKANDTIFTASFDGNIVKWNAETGDATRFAGKGHGTKVSGLAYNPNTNKLVSVGSDNKVRFSDPDECQYNPDSAVGLDSEPFSMSITSDGDVVVACENELVLVKDGRKSSSISWKDNSNSIVVAQGTKVVASGKVEKRFGKEGQTGNIYEIDGGNICDTKESFEVTKKITSMSISSDSARVAVADEKIIRIYEFADGFEKPSKTLIGHSTSCICSCWSPDGQHFASAGLDGTLILWDLNNDKFTKISGAHPKTVLRAVAWLDDNTVVSVAEDCTVKQWTVTF